MIEIILMCQSFLSAVNGLFDIDSLDCIGPQNMLLNFELVFNKLLSPVYVRFSIPTAALLSQEKLRHCVKFLNL